MSDTTTPTPAGKLPMWSKTIIVNIIAIAATWIANKTGFTLDATDQVTILGIVNIGLRLITKQPIVWS